MQSTVRKWEHVPLGRDDRFDTYFHTLSHDLRTPLNHINGFAELLYLDDGLPVAHKEYAEAIVSACRELKHAVLAHLQLIEHSLNCEQQACHCASNGSARASLVSRELERTFGSAAPQNLR